MSGSVRIATVAVALAALLCAASPTQAVVPPVSLTWERQWGSNGLLDGQFHYPPDVATDTWGNVYVAGGESGDNRIQMFTADGTFIKSVGTTDSPNTGIVNHARSIATDRWCMIYVAEKDPGLVQVFNPRLYSLSGTFQESPIHEIWAPNGIAVGLDGTAYLTDNGTSVQRWRNRSYVGEWAPAGIGAIGVGVSHDRDVYATTDITSGTTNSVIKYTSTGDYVTSWGGSGTGSGQFARPYDVATDPLGNVYVIESEGPRSERGLTARISRPSARSDPGTDSSRLPMASQSVSIGRSTWPTRTFTASRSGT
ncbi:hypothetical protein MX659_04290 [Coriobacteriia bacterium Es71-Z0120]|uniref:hypothetical protein n=1 Tax=Parvivirga hydrogeniphila TaxID=2939460 RepID=UPI002260B23C|nr:hypothetical protein [Parvivirga hydrogeniphila]MCL4078819.1 hypothetical protein [Parvivirga hydrogeniphila]